MRRRRHSCRFRQCVIGDAQIYVPVSEKSFKAFERSCRKASFELVWSG